MAHWNLRPSEAIEVTVPRTVRRRSGVLVHSLALPTDEVTTLEGIPVTTVPRTIFDLASLGPRAVERTIHEAEHQQLTDSLSLAALVERYEHRRHSGVIKRVLSSYTAGQGITANEFEEAFDTFDTFLESRGFPAPEKNSWVQPGDRWNQGRLVCRDRERRRKPSSPRKQGAMRPSGRERPMTPECEGLQGPSPTRSPPTSRKPYSASSP